MLKKILLVITLIAIVLVIGSLLFVYLYRDELKSYAAHEINEQLNTNLSEENFSLNFFHGFPYAAVAAHNLKREAETESDQDLYFEIGSLSVYFHIPDLIFSKFNLKKIKLENAVIRISDTEKDQAGENGFLKNMFARDSDMELNLKNASFKNVKLIFEDGPQHQTQILLKNIGLHIFWQDQKRLLDVEGVFGIRIMDGTIAVFESGELDTRLALDFFSDEIIYQVISGYLKSPGLQFYLNGTSLGEDFLKLQLTTDQLDLDEFQNSELLKKYVDLGDIRLSGNAAINALLESWFFTGNTPYISGDFELENASVRPKQSNFAFEDIDGTGTFSNGPARNLRSTFISLNKAEMQYGDSKLRLKIRVDDLLAPLIQAEIEGKVNVEALINDIGKDLIPGELRGYPDISISWKRQRPGWGPLELQDILYSKTDASIGLVGLTGKINAYPLPFKIAGGNLHFNNNELKLTDVRFQTEKSRLVLNSSIKGLFSYLLFKENPLHINSKISSPFMDVEEFASVSPESTLRDSTSKYPPVTLGNMFLIDSLAWDDFLATKLSSEINYNHNQITFRHLELDAFGGRISSDGILKISSDQYMLDADASFQGCNISRMFRELNDFSQKEITHQNLSGEMDAELNFKASFDNSFEPLLSSILLRSEFEIRNGNLKNYKPLMESLKFLNDDSLKNISFHTLKNNIKIQDQIVHIPQMEIKSNVLDLEGYGTHSFDDEIDYHFKILLSELLSKKARQKKNDFEEYGYIEDDGLGQTALYFHLTGTVDDFQFKYDKKAVREKIIADFKEESRKIKEDFSEEFEWLKRDPEKVKEREEMKEYFETQEEGNFILEWESEPDTSINK